MNNNKIILFVYALFLLVTSSIIKNYLVYKKTRKRLEFHINELISFIEINKIKELEDYYNKYLLEINKQSKLDKKYLDLMNIVEEFLKEKGKTELIKDKLNKLRES